MTVDPTERCERAIIEVLADQIIRGAQHPANLAFLVMQVHDRLCTGHVDLTRSLTDAVLARITDLHATGPQIAAIVDRLVGQGRVLRTVTPEGRTLLQLNAPKVGDRIDIAVAPGNTIDPYRYDRVSDEHGNAYVLVPATVAGYTRSGSGVALLATLDRGHAIPGFCTSVGASCTWDLQPLHGIDFRPHTASKV